MHHSSGSAWHAADGHFQAPAAPRVRPRRQVPTWFRLAVACVLASGSIGVSAQIAFQALPAITAGLRVSAIAVGDFDGDGILDLAATNSNNNYVYIFLGNGNGTFRFGGAHLVGADPHSVVAVDLNHDGKLDLAVGNIASNNVSILLGRGDGTFSAAVPYAVALPYSLAVGSFNPDGFSDLVVASGNNVVLLRGNGDGTFYTGWTSPSIPTPRSVATGVFTASGDSDIVVTSAAAADVKVFLGNAGGGFSAPTSFAAGSGASGIAVADFNGDGKSDLAVTESDSAYGVVLLGAGDGTFPLLAGYAAGSSSGSSFTAPAIADFDGDGRLDMGMVIDGDNTIGVLHGKGTAPYDLFYPAALTLYGFLNTPTCIAVGDFTGDSKPDLVVGDDTGNIVVFVNVSGRIFANGFEQIR